MISLPNKFSLFIQGIIEKLPAGEALSIQAGDLPMQPISIQSIRNIISVNTTFQTQFKELQAFKKYQILSLEKPSSLQLCLIYAKAILIFSEDELAKLEKIHNLYKFSPPFEREKFYEISDINIIHIWISSALQNQDIKLLNLISKNLFARYYFMTGQNFNQIIKLITQTEKNRQKLLPTIIAMSKSLFDTDPRKIRNKIRQFLEVLPVDTQKRCLNPSLLKQWLEANSQGCRTSKKTANAMRIEHSFELIKAIALVDCGAEATDLMKERVDHAKKELLRLYPGEFIDLFLKEINPSANLLFTQHALTRPSLITKGTDTLQRLKYLICNNLNDLKAVDEFLAITPAFKNASKADQQGFLVEMLTQIAKHSSSVCYYRFYDFLIQETKIQYLKVGLFFTLDVVSRNNPNHFEHVLKEIEEYTKKGLINIHDMLKNSLIRKSCSICLSALPSFTELSRCGIEDKDSAIRSMQQSIISLIPKEKRLAIILDTYNGSINNVISTITTSLQMEVILEALNKEEQVLLFPHVLKTASPGVLDQYMQHPELAKTFLNRMPETERIEFIKNSRLIFVAIKLNNISLIRVALESVSEKEQVNLLVISAQQEMTAFRYLLSFPETPESRKLFIIFWTLFTPEQHTQILLNEDLYVKSAILCLASNNVIDFEKFYAAFPESDFMDSLLMAVIQFMTMEKPEHLETMYSNIEKSPILKEKFEQVIRLILARLKPGSDASLANYNLLVAKNFDKIEYKVAIVLLNEYPVNKLHLFEGTVPNIKKFITELVESKGTHVESIIQIIELLGLKYSPEMELFVANALCHCNNEKYQTLVTRCISKYLEKPLLLGRYRSLALEVLKNPTLFSIPLSTSLILNNTCWTPSAVATITRAVNDPAFHKITSQEGPFIINPNEMTLDLTLKVMYYLNVPEHLRGSVILDTIDKFMDEPTCLNFLKLFSYIPKENRYDMYWLLLNFDKIKSETSRFQVAIGLLIDDITYIFKKLDYLKENNKPVVVSNFIEIINTLMQDEEFARNYYIFLQNKLFNSKDAAFMVSISTLVLYLKSILKLPDNDPLINQANIVFSVARAPIRGQVLGFGNVLNILENTSSTLQLPKIFANISSERVTFDFKSMQTIAAYGKYTVNNLPTGIDEHKINALVQSIENKLSVLSAANQKRLLAQMTESLPALKKNLNSPFFKLLFDEVPNAQGEISSNKYYLYASLHSIVDASNNVFKADDFFERSDRFFILAMKDLLNPALKTEDALRKQYELLPQSYIDFVDLTPQNSNIIIELKDALQKKIDALSEDERLSVIQFFEETFAIPYHDFQAFFVNYDRLQTYAKLLHAPQYYDTTFTEHEISELNKHGISTTEKRLVNEPRMHLVQILHRILDNKDFLTPSEQALIAFSSSVALCPAGKQSGLRLYYEGLPAKYKHHGQADSKDLQARMENFLDDAVQKSMNRVFENDLFLREATKTHVSRQVFQPKHQTLFLQNLLYKLLGFKHDAKTDFYTSTTLDLNLLTTSPQQLLEIYLKYFTLEYLNEFIIKLSKKGNKDWFYQAVMEYLGKRIDNPQSNPEEYFEFDEDYTPIKLTPKGASKLLQIRGYFKLENSNKRKATDFSDREHHVKFAKVADE